MQLVKDLLTSLPGMFSQSRETHSALGPALQAAFKLMSPTGGRVTVFQTQLPTLGAGALQSREDPNQRSSTKASRRERTCFMVFVLFLLLNFQGNLIYLSGLPRLPKTEPYDQCSVARKQPFIFLQQLTFITCQNDSAGFSSEVPKRLQG